jgi:hypothetical protein
MATHVHFTQISCDVDDIFPQEIIEGNHVNLLAKEHIVSKILHNLCDIHEAATNDWVRGGFNINERGVDDSRRDKPKAAIQLNVMTQP